MLKPGNTYAGRFYVSDPTTGGSVDADSLPTGSLIRNGDVDGAVTVTISNITTGIYKYSCTVPSSYTAGDIVLIQISGELDSVAFAGAVESRTVIQDYSPQATEIWAYSARTLTSTAAEIAATVAADGSLVVHRGDTWSATITGLGDISLREKLWFTAKSRTGDPLDSASKIMILEYAGTDEDSGLLLIEGAAATSTANGSITVDDEDVGDITITIEAIETAKLVISSRLIYDIQVLNANGDVTTLSTGSLSITSDITRDID